MKVTISTKRNKSYLKSLAAGTVGQTALLPGDVWDNLILPLIMFVSGFILATVVMIGGFIANFFAGIAGLCHSFSDDEWDALEGDECIKSKPKSKENDG